MNEELLSLKRQVERLEDFILSLQSSSLISLNTDRAFRGRGYIAGTSPLTGIAKANGSSPATAIVPKAGAQGPFFVATSSGGAVTTRLDFTDGVLTAVN